MQSIFKPVNTNENHAVIKLKPQADFVSTDYIKRINRKSLSYLDAGFAIHLRGAAGTGKTTMAMHIAHQLQRPVIMVHGDAEMTTESLAGSNSGFQSSKIDDNYIHSVHKVQESYSKMWNDSRLSIACKKGYVFLYDEFTRSKPEANNILLSVLQERILDIPQKSGKDGYIKVHPDFKAIFTSNPEDYAGVNKSQDALKDRMITIDMEPYDHDTEIAITQAKSGVSHEAASYIVNLVSKLRNSNLCENPPSIRSCIKLAKVMHTAGYDPIEDKEMLFDFSRDILGSEVCRNYDLKALDKVMSFVKKAM